MKKLKSFLYVFRKWLGTRQALWVGIILLSLIIFGSVVALFSSIYVADEPSVVAPKTRQDIRGAIKENIAEPIAKIIPVVGQPIVNAAYVSPVIKSTNQNPDSGQTTDLTSNWQTYRDEKLGFEIKYPEDYGIYQREEGLITFAQTSDFISLRSDQEKYADSGLPYWGGHIIQIKMVNNAVGKTLDAYIAEQFGEEGVVKSNQAGKGYVRAEDHGPNRYGGGVGYYYVLEKNNYIYEIGLDYFMNQVPDNAMIQKLNLVAESFK